MKLTVFLLATFFFFNIQHVILSNPLVLMQQMVETISRQITKMES